MSRSQILPAIIALWGAAIVLNTLFGGTNGSGAYGAGQTAAGIFGIVMVAVGVRAFRKARIA